MGTGKGSSRQMELQRQTRVFPAMLVQNGEEPFSGAKLAGVTPMITPQQGEQALITDRAPRLIHLSVLLNAQSVVPVVRLEVRGVPRPIDGRHGCRRTTEPRYRPGRGSTRYRGARLSRRVSGSESRIAGSQNCSARAAVGNSADRKEAECYFARISVTYDLAEGTKRYEVPLPARAAPRSSSTPS